MSAKSKHWFIGIVLAIIGIVLVRVVSGMYEAVVPKMVIYVIGIVIAFAGLVIIMQSFRKR